MLNLEAVEQQPTAKHINLVMNGNPEKQFLLSYRHCVELSDILRVVESRWNFKYSRCIRLFNHEGVEFEQGDLRYLRPNDNVYVSRGEEFDANSSFGEYEVLRQLGEGGFGRVSLARHKSSDQLVAIKTMKAERIKSAHEIDVVFREIENLKLLHHPNIVRIFKCYTLKEMKVVMVMEYLEGGEMLEYVTKRGRLEPKHSLIFMRQIASAIEYCHRKNIVHRDLKLENILLTSQQGCDIKVADFGISGVAEQFNPDCDTGTLKYMTPEVLSGVEKGNSPAVDVWAMGCIFYYLLFGKLPFVGKNSAETIRLIIEGAYKVPKEVEVEEDYLRLLARQTLTNTVRMLDVNPKTRIKCFGVCEELRQLGQPKLVALRTEETINVADEKLTVELQHQQPSEYLIPRSRKEMQPRKSKPNSLLPFIPKRLEKEKDIIESELREYRNRKKTPFDRNLLRSYESKHSQVNLPKRPLLRDRSLAPPIGDASRSRNSLSEVRKFK